MNSSYEKIEQEPYTNQNTNIENDDINFNEIFKSDYIVNTSKIEEYYNQKIQNSRNLSIILKTDIEKGLNTKDITSMQWREQKYGNNHYIPEKPLKYINFILECFEDPMLRLLLISSIISLIIGIIKDGISTGWIEGTAIFTAVFIVVGISSYLNYNEKLQYRLLSLENQKKHLIVQRDGTQREIDSENLLVGDILIMKIGDIIEVDGLLISNDNISVDESAVNGESDLVKKSSYFHIEDSIYITPIVLSGTKIQDGKGAMIVCTVGENTFSGKNKKLIQSSNNKLTEEDLTPLKKQLNDLADIIGKFGYIMAILIGVVIIGREMIIKVKKGKKIFDSEMVDITINAFILAITIIVVAIPEGLPMAVAIALAYSLRKMKHEHNLVKNLDSSETMGNVNNICTDKTGTLTIGKMSVDNIWFEMKNCDIDDIKKLNDEKKEIIIDAIENNITIVKTDNKENFAVLNGDMTERALYLFIAEIRNLKEKDKENKKLLYVLPFSHENKYMISIFKYNNRERYILYIKGAYEKINNFFTKIRVSENKEEPYEKYTNEINDIIAKYANDTKRILIFGSREISKEEMNTVRQNKSKINFDFFNSFCNEMTLLFIIGIKDPLRKDVPHSIKQCTRAGITIRMITGDNILTALSVSKNAGIISESEINKANVISYQIKDLIANKKVLSPDDFDSPIALEGEEFRKLSGNLIKTYDNKNTNKIKSIELGNIEMFKKVVSKLKVIARASPEDKFLLVLGLKKLNNIIAVTGDGTNDAPALKQAHVGFAMGKRGTDIAKEAADIILLDDSFSSIITACKFGRNVYDCIRKFIQFQLTTNIVAVFMTLLSGIFIEDSPLNCIEMLWVNLIMDSFASLALATESPNDSLLDRKPYKRGSSILTRMMKVNIISQGIFQIAVLSAILYYGDSIFGVKSDCGLEHYEWNDENGYHFTIFFNVFVFMQVFNSINARKLSKKEWNVFKGILGNFYYLFVQGFIIIGQVLIVTFGGRAVRTKRLTVKQHLQCVGIASVTLFVGFVVKFIPINMEENMQEVIGNDDLNRERVEEEEKLKEINTSISNK